MVGEVQSTQEQVRRISKPPVGRREGSGISGLRRMWESIRDRFSSRITPIPEAEKRISAPPEPVAEGQGRPFEQRRVGTAERLLKSMQKREMFWKTDLEHLMFEMKRLFNPRYGSIDTYNQRCAVMVIAAGLTLLEMGEKGRA